MTPQSVFNKLIPGYYNEGTLRWGMCAAVFDAQGDGFIDQKEADVALQAVAAYLEKTRYTFLRNALRASSLPHDDADLLAIYQNWENRPLLHAVKDEGYDYA